MKQVRINLSESGLHMLYNDYQLLAIAYLDQMRKQGSYTNTRDTWENVCYQLYPDWDGEALTSPVSRASIINFLQHLASEGVAQSNIKTGKGGHHGLYRLSGPASQILQAYLRKFVLKCIDYDSDSTLETLEEFYEEE